LFFRKSVPKENQMTENMSVYSSAHIITRIKSTHIYIYTYIYIHIYIHIYIYIYRTIPHHIAFDSVALRCIIITTTITHDCELMVLVHIYKYMYVCHEDSASKWA
jgi:hypothetical protein